MATVLRALLLIAGFSLPAWVALGIESQEGPERDRRFLENIPSASSDWVAANPRQTQVGLTDDTAAPKPRRIRAESDSLGLQK